jgi:hypothetical protein
MDRDTFLDRIPANVRGFVSDLLDALAGLGADDITWPSPDDRLLAARIWVTRRGTRGNVVWLEPKSLQLQVAPSYDFPAEPFERAKAALIRLGAIERTAADKERPGSAGAIAPKGAWYRLGWPDDERLVRDVGDVAVRLCAELLDRPPPPSLGAVYEYRRAVAGDLNTWWSGDGAEKYWLEITDRVDIGIDLHCPQRDAGGNRSAGFSLIWWVEPGDVVFHYDRKVRAITAWSRAVGHVVEAPVTWLPHRAATRRRIGVARPQPGWWLDLEGRYELSTPLQLAALRAYGDRVRAVMEALAVAHGGRPLYLPFFFHGGTELRPMQTYLNKVPAALVNALPELGDAAATASTTEITATSTKPYDAVGAAYRRATWSELPDSRDPFAVDPALVERGLHAHVDTQNKIAGLLEASGIEPRSPRPDEPDFDLAWAHGGTVYVGEVKSITRANEEKQLRLGLGQVLRYRSLLNERLRSDVRAVLIAETEPRDDSWRALCEEVGVVLVAGPDFEGALPQRLSA